MKIIREADMLVGVLEQGELKADLSAKIAEVLCELYAMSDEAPKGTFKGSLTLKMKFSVQNNMATINNDISTTVPKRPRRADVFWVTEDGGLSTEHPNQRDMFGGPRAIETSRQ